MRTLLIESYLDALRDSFGQARPPIAHRELQALYEVGDYEGMIYLVRKILCLDMRLYLGLVNSGGPPKAPAWVKAPQNMPPIGTSAFRATSVTVYLRKSFLRESSFERVTMAMAHELCHVVLFATNHPLQEKEEAVDLTAMLLGFQDFYLNGCHTKLMEKRTWLDCLLGRSPYIIRTTGYLSLEEIEYARAYMATY